MRKVPECGDHDGLRRLAHQIKGVSRSYGYPMLTEAAKALEEVDTKVVCRLWTSLPYFARLHPEAEICT